VTKPDPPIPEDIRAYLAAQGRKGGKVGGKRRAAKMSWSEKSAWGAYMVKRREDKKKARADAQAPDAQPEEDESSLP